MFKVECEDYTTSKYEYIGIFKEGLARVKNIKGLWGFINKSGKEVIPCQYKKVLDFSEGLASVKNSDGLWGFINKSGKEVISCQYIGVENFQNGYAVVKEKKELDTLCRYVDKDGNGFKQYFNEAYGFSKVGLAAVRFTLNNRWGYVDNKGMCYGNFLQASSFFDGMAIAVDNTGVYVIDKSLNQLRRLDADKFRLIEFCEELFYVKTQNNKLGYYDNKFNEKIPCIYSKLERFSDGAAIFELEPDIIGFVNKKGQSILFSKKTQYQEIMDFSEGLAAVKNIKGLWGFINKAGNEVISCQYAKVDSFSEGLAGVLDADGNLYYIDKKGSKKMVPGIIYCAFIKAGDLDVYVTAESEQEFSEKKLQTLRLVRERIITQVTDNIDNLAFDVPVVVGKGRKRKKEG